MLVAMVFLLFDALAFVAVLGLGGGAVYVFWNGIVAYCFHGPSISFLVAVCIWLVIGFVKYVFG